MTEAELTLKVMALCDELGLLYHHCGDSRVCSGTVGLPDLIVLGEGGMLLAELKSADGNMTTGQHIWLRTAARADHYYGVVATVVWKPADLQSGQVRRVLGQLVEGWS